MNPDSKLEEVLRLDQKQKTALKKLGLSSVRDLLYHFPTRYSNTAEIESINTLEKGKKATLFGKVSALKTSKAFRKKIPMSEALLDDGNGKIKLIWFHQPYIAKLVKEGASVKVEGTVGERNGVLYMANPDIEQLSKLPVAVGKSLFGKTGENFHLHPVYPETKGLSSNWFQFAIKKIVQSKILETIEDPIPEDILKRYSLPTLKTALVWIHFPKKERDATAARKRFAFEEIFYIQIQKHIDRLSWQQEEAFAIETDKKKVSEFVKRFGFTPTKAQLKSIDHILTDFKKTYPMARLLEGDVGSGKTAVAATVSFAVATSRPKNQDFGNLQVVYMAPTEILAKQHFESFIKLFSHLPINIGLLTGSGCYKFPSKSDPSKPTPISRSQLLKWVANGEIPILIGTHALIQKSVTFKHLALVIIDEQHRFGTNQRKTLVHRPNADLTQTNAEEKKDAPVSNQDTELLYRDLTYIIRRCIFNVKKELGLGHKEVVYQKALAEELTQNNISFNRETQIPIFYRNKKVGTYIPDFVVENKVIVELKSLPFIGPREKKQLRQYLKSSDYNLALLVNFGNTKDVSIERVIYGNKQVEKSVLSPHEVRVKSASVPHLLSMTATPIPRTLALTIYGDLDISLLDELPAGRKPVETEIIYPQKRNEVYEKIRGELKAGRQVYVICPRINEPDPTKVQAILAKSVKEEAARLKRSVFQEYEIDILHSKMTPKEKDDVMNRFSEGNIDILVATSVVEVGVNVPNATVIIIEGAERFGLAQLHQLRGRVLRSSHQPYCYIFTDSKSDKTIERLKALKTAKNGFELSEQDLKLRGAGELYGGKQWGITDIGMEAIRNLKMVEAARQEAEKIVREDSSLENYPVIQKIILEQKGKIHFE